MDLGDKTGIVYYIIGHCTTIPDGWVAQKKAKLMIYSQKKTKLMLYSTLLKVEVGVELGN